MNVISLVLTTQQIEQLKKKYKSYLRDKVPPYAYYQIKLNDCVITAYESKKVVFQGEGAAFYAETFGAEKQKKVKEKQVDRNQYPQCGSDEVGTGDYFGPVCVCACYVEEKDLSLLEELHIQDSKQLKDENILVIAPILMEKLTHSLLILSNEKYNKIHETYNMNAIKALLHNKAYLNLNKKLGGLPALQVIDQFTPATSYYRYLKDETEKITSLHFETKAENKYLSVACGSIIARYAFLKEMQAMNEKYQVNFPFGAGVQVDVFIKEFVDQYSFATLNEVAKTHFKNSEKAFFE